MTKIAAAQMKMSPDTDENYRKALALIRLAAENGAEMICFPEGQLSRYAPQYRGLSPEAYAVPADHPYVEGLRAACRENRIIACVTPNLLENGRVYPAGMIISQDGRVLGVGKKNHIVMAEHFYEQDYFSPGPGGFCVADTSVGRVGIVMCFDRHYPESFRFMAMNGADFVFVPVANERAEPGEMFEWEIRVPAFQNSLNILMCNRVGTEGGMDFCGGSIFADFDGGVAARADDSEQLLYAQADLSGAAGSRRARQYLPLLRPEVFAP
jgi:predicted amidohydrolase